MDYNEYDSNGNKKKINFNTIINDKQKRAWLILGMYFIFIFAIIVLIRSNYSNNEQKESKKETNEQIEETNNNKESEEKDELDKMFSYIDENNYNFKFMLNYNNEQLETIGKRYNNKFEFTYSNKGQSLYFLGTVSNLKMKKDDSYISIVFPYTYFNYFDNNVIKEIIRNSIYNYNSNKYEISSKKFNEILNHSATIDNDGINTIELITKNNKVVEIKVDFSSALAMIDPSETTAIISLNYYDFGLIDDFNISFE